MAHDTDLQAKAHEYWWLRAARVRGGMWAFVIAISIARLVWLWIGRYTLVEDEAHYWEWARRLDWSYYSKGPGVAWVIWASTSLFGNVEWAVRLPAVLASAVGSIAVGSLAREVSGDRRAALLAAVFYQGVPGIMISSVLMTIDAPYLACWAVACWAGHKAMVKGWGPGWVWLAAAIAIGFLFKYTALLLVPGLVGYWMFAGGARPRVARRWLVMAALVLPLGLMPVLIWNAQHDWDTFRHLLGHLGAPGGDVAPNPDAAGWGYNPMFSLEYLGLQLAVGGPVLLLAIVGLIGARRSVDSPVRGPGVALMVWCSAPILVFYLAVSVVTQVEGNWAMGAFVSLCAIGPMQAILIGQRGPIAMRLLVGGSIFAGPVAMALFMVAPEIARNPLIGHWIPVARVTGMREHAAAVQAEVDALRDATGLKPFVITEHWGRTSELAFYMPGHPTVYCASSLIGGRRAQYDIWAETDLHNPELIAALLGRPAVVMGGKLSKWDGVFASLEDIGQLDREPKRGQPTYIGLEFRGFEADAVEEDPSEPEQESP